jgi:hypothetical protein
MHKNSVDKANAWTNEQEKLSSDKKHPDCIEILHMLCFGSGYTSRTCNTNKFVDLEYPK